MIEHKPKRQVAPKRQYCTHAVFRLSLLLHAVSRHSSVVACCINVLNQVQWAHSISIVASLRAWRSGLGHSQKMSAASNACASVVCSSQKGLGNFFQQVRGSPHQAALSNSHAVSQVWL